jgi:hypothetical protein
MWTLPSLDISNCYWHDYTNSKENGRHEDAHFLCSSPLKPATFNWVVRLICSRARRFTWY